MANRIAKKDLIDSIESANDDPEQQLELLKNITISEAKSDSDKELFTLVASAIKKSTKKAKATSDKIKGKFQTKIAAAKEKLDALKSDLSKQVGPYTGIIHELKRIDVEARQAISAFATKQMQELESQHEDLEPHEKAMLPATENKTTRVKGVAMSFREQPVVVVKNIDKVPGCYQLKEPDKSAVLAWFGAKTGVPAEEVSVQANGLVVLKIRAEDLPDETKNVVGVKEAAILAAGGCAGVAITVEKRPVVRG